MSSTPAVADVPAASEVPPERAKDVGSPYAWYVLGVLVLVYMLNFIDRQILSILAEDIKADLGIDDGQMGFLYGTAFAVFYALFGIPLGRLADMWVRKTLMAIGLFVWSTMTALSGLSQNFTQIAGARIGVGVGEAAASPCAFSMLSDYFPKESRATALAIYSGGLYLGGGISLFIGGAVAGNWNAAFPGGWEGPFGMNVVGWQAAFLAVGIPGILIAIWVATLREPLRGMSEGIVEPPAENIWRKFFQELSSVIPPFTLFDAARGGARSLAINIAGAVIIIGSAIGIIQLVGDTFATRLQFGALAIGAYAVFSWSRSVKRRDPATYALIWGTPSFLLMLVGFGTIAFNTYAVSFWSAPYVLRTFDNVNAATVGLIIGGAGAAGGFLGVILGGRFSDFLKRRNPAGRILVGIAAITLMVPFVLIMFTTDSLLLFYVLALPSNVVASAWVGVAAATSQDLVLPRMRGAATATYFIGTTLIGLGLGPWFAGEVSARTGDLTTGVLSLLVMVPVTLICLFCLYKRLPLAEATKEERAAAAVQAAH